MKLKNTTIGIWGFGVVGQAAARFCSSRGAHVLVWDDYHKDLPYTNPSSLADFLAQSEKIIVSPGIDISAYYHQYQDKWLSELDLFHHYCTKKIIAITGTLGKTSVTTMLTASLKQLGWRVVAAGNIGTGCLDILAQQDDLDAIILEVSSFQLEYCQTFSPDLAIWTNFYPNHLDRHRTLDEYFNAKLNIIAHQHSDQHAILPEAIKKNIVSQTFRAHITYCDETGIKQNKQIVALALRILTNSDGPIQLPSLEHRLEHVATINSAIFINDSKSTTPQSTLAAIQEYKNMRILLFLGGLSKGVDRSDLIKQLAGTSIIVLCFGKEASALHEFCIKNDLKSYQCATLEQAFSTGISLMQPGDCILFSPAGSSYDLFKNYQDRGKCFKNYVMQYAQQSR